MIDSILTSKSPPPLFFCLLVTGADSQLCPTTCRNRFMMPKKLRCGKCFVKCQKSDFLDPG